MAIAGMNHFTVLTAALEDSVAFYTKALGFETGERPPFSFPGAWLYAAGAPIIHLVAKDKLPASTAGVLDHMAFSATDLPGVANHLRQLDIPFNLGRQPGTGIWQLFMHDPNGAKIELDFDPQEPAP
ncbi:VOC family protein [Cupriavidus basilensis]|uniref:Putative dioxygenase n=1 Tax=Cupriavidus basilensis TaxID=68895 RepID=A0A0C4YU00_9BURK|nr:VOC family protein [Cupriavidus basilensis]AJG24081.1 putative dioxygenase [Cupriavidus basilensis]